MGQTAGEKAQDASVVKAVNETNRLYDAKDYPNFYPGQTVAGFDPVQQQGQQWLYNTLTNTGEGGVTDSINKAQYANNQMLDPNFLWNLNAIPGYAGAKQGVVQDTSRALAESWMPSVRADAIGNGAFGGSRGQIGEALAASRAADELSKNLSNLDLNIYGNNLSAQGGAINRTAGLVDLQQMPSQNLINLGGQKQAQTQAEIAAARERYDYAQKQPWEMLDQLRTSANLPTHGVQAQPAGPSTAATIGGALLAGIGTFGNSGSNYPGTPPYTNQGATPQSYTYF